MSANMEQRRTRAPGQREILASLGVPPDWIHLDKGLTGTTRARPGLD
jgi:hypothetical protein